MGGDAAQNWLILSNGATVIGLFQGVFPANTLTFNPGWDQAASNVGEFTDIRQIAAALKERGLEPVLDTTGDSAAGPAHLTLVDPDGNPILIDQHR